MQQKLTVFFSDIANSTWLYQQEGDVQAHRMITTCLGNLRETVEKCNGSLLRTVGDAVLASFESSDDAFMAAVSSQRMQVDSSLRLRIGFHFGEVIPDSGDVYGNAVNIAARVASFANAEEIFTTEETVARLSIDHRKSATYLDRVDFKGIAQPLPIYRVQWLETSTSKPLIDTRIITAVNRGEKYRSNRILELKIGEFTLQVDEQNPRVSIGREIDNDIVIDHGSTSRHHATIELQRGRYAISDASTNGTYIVRGGQDAVFVRRESIALQQQGIIGVGWHPSDGDTEKISFQLVAPESEGDM
ncbi:MAG: adenylate/guanylate cyclase domain-containing protein [Granulosicoccus sp.]|nr:adenylate/guanylate cyclase domain-containing protein [Granulosicoccus sp.]